LSGASDAVSLTNNCDSCHNPVAACNYGDGPNRTKRYLELGIDAPQKNEVVVCHAYGCKMKTAYRFTSANMPRSRV